MPKILYIDASAGLSGDMLAGGLMDLGWPLDDLKQMVELLGLSEVALEQVCMEHGGVMASRLEVTVGGHHHHGSDHHHHGDDGGHKHGHHDHHGTGGQEHSHGHDGHHQHRNLPYILELLKKLPPEVCEPASRVFKRLAEAEAKVHGSSPEEVHFHEVGAADAIVDIVAFCAGMHWLGVDQAVCSPLPLGRGFVKCAHGLIPLPAPAVLNLIEGLPTKPWPEDVETVTPTGAALVSTLCEAFGDMPSMKLIKSGTGCGSRVNRYAPNIVRLMLGKAGQDNTPLTDEVVEIVCHIDDMNPEDLPLAYERFFACGALDVACAPLLAKKGRPALQLIVMCKPEKLEGLAECMLSETTSLGVRIRPVKRRILPRRLVSVDTPWGPVAVKLAGTGDYEKAHVEADDIMDICRDTGLTAARVRAKVLELMTQQDPL